MTSYFFFFFFFFFLQVSQIKYNWVRSSLNPWSKSNSTHCPVLRIPQSSSTAGTSPSDCLVSYPGHSLGGGLTPLQRCSRCILQPLLTRQLVEWVWERINMYSMNVRLLEVKKWKRIREYGENKNKNKSAVWIIERFYDLSLYIYFSFHLLLDFIKMFIVVLSTLVSPS